LGYADVTKSTAVLYVGSLGGKLYALSTSDGSEIWQASLGGEIRGTPAYVDGVVYVGAGDGRLYAFDATSGEPGTSPLGQQLEKAAIYASPVFDGQHLYIVATNGQVYALDPDRNVAVWDTNPLGAED
jgi:outer membrane protein assembly factor BamB